MLQWSYQVTMERLHRRREVCADPRREASKRQPCGSDGGTCERERPHEGQVRKAAPAPRRGRRTGAARPLAAAALIAALADFGLVAPAAAQTPPPSGSPPAASSPPPDAPDSQEAEPTSEGDSDAPPTTKREQARAAYFAGKSAFAAGDFAQAEAQFTLANSLIPAVRAQFWRAMSIANQNKVQLALHALTNLLAQPDLSSLTPEQIEEAKRRQKELQSTPAEVMLGTEPAGAKLTVSGVPIQSPTPVPLRLAPGQHVITVELEGYVSQRFLLTAEPGAKISPVIKLTPVPASKTPALSPPPLEPQGPLDEYAAQRSKVPAIVTLGIAGVSGVIGTIFGLKALSEKSDFDDDPTTEGADDVERNALIADMAFGVTLTLGITGAVLLLSEEPGGQASLGGKFVGGHRKASPRLTFAPFVAPTAAGAAASLKF